MTATPSGSEPAKAFSSVGNVQLGNVLAELEPVIDIVAKYGPQAENFAQAAAPYIGTWAENILVPTSSAATSVKDYESGDKKGALEALLNGGLMVTVSSIFPKLGSLMGFANMALGPEAVTHGIEHAFGLDKAEAVNVAGHSAPLPTPKTPQAGAQGKQPT